MAASNPICDHGQPRFKRTWFLKYRALAIFCLVALAQAVHAEDGCDTKDKDCVAIGKWNLGVSLGAGVRTNPLAGGRDIPLVVIPQVSYYGKHVFLDDLDAGVFLYDKGNVTVSLVASPGYDRVYFYRSDLQNIFVTGFVPETAADGTTIAYPVSRNVPDRRRSITYLAGPEWTFKVDRLSAQLDVLHDITGHDHGTEVRAAVGMPLLEGRHGTLSGNAGLTWKSASIVDYYYGAPPYYEGGAALDPFVKLAYSLPLSRKWKLSALLQTERLADSIANSPLISNRYVETVFAGATYTW
jgi:outer membrane protein